VAILKSLTIQNFKAISDPVRIDFKPITLLFGPNSAGKSTIIQALHYVREIFVNHNLDPHRVNVHGEQVDLGGFKAIVHNHDLTLPINLELDLELGEEKLPNYIQDEEILDQVTECARIYLDCLQRVRRVSVGISVRWAVDLARPYTASYRVSLEGEFFCEISEWNPTLLPELLHEKLSAGSAGSRAALQAPKYLNFLRVNFRHSSFLASDTTKPSNLLTEIAELLFEDPWEWHSNGESPEQGHGTLIFTSHGALPDWDNPPYLMGDLKDIDTTGLGDPDSYRLPQGLAELFNRGIAGPGKLACSILGGLRYLGPLRAIPPRLLEQSGATQQVIAPSGLGTWEELFSADKRILGEINTWLSGAEKLNSGYTIDVKRYKELDEGLLAAIENGRIKEVKDFEGTLRNLPARSRLTLHKVPSGMELSIQDVGTGISQVLPVIITSLLSRDQLVAIEQPELHIHPALQVTLADMFIAQAMRSNVFFILETHSEHLMLRLLRRIRETSENEVDRGAHRR